MSEMFIKLQANQSLMSYCPARSSQLTVDQPALVPLLLQAKDEANLGSGSIISPEHPVPLCLAGA